MMPPLSVAGSCDKRLIADFGGVPAILYNTKFIHKTPLFLSILYFTVIIVLYGCSTKAPNPRLQTKWTSLNSSNKLAISATSLPTGSTLRVVPSTAWWSGMPKRCRFSVSRHASTQCSGWNGRPTRSSLCAACTKEELCRYIHMHVRTHTRVGLCTIQVQC